MTGNRSRPFFDLQEAAQLCQRLVKRPRASVDAPHKLGRAREPLRERPTSPTTLPALDVSAQTNATALWRALLEWASLATKSDGVFALDARGFLITAVGNLDPFPPEVFSEAFAAATRLFETYLSETQEIASISLVFAPIGRFTLRPIAVGYNSVLIGFAGENPIDARRLSQVCERIIQEVSFFDEKTSRRTGGDASLDTWERK